MKYTVHQCIIDSDLICIFICAAQLQFGSVSLTRLLSGPSPWRHTAALFVRSFTGWSSVLVHALISNHLCRKKHKHTEVIICTLF